LYAPNEPIVIAHGSKTMHDVKKIPKKAQYKSCTSVKKKYEYPMPLPELSK